MKAVIQSAGSCPTLAGLECTKLGGRLGPSLKSHLSKRAEGREAMIARDSKWGCALPFDSVASATSSLPCVSTDGWDLNSLSVSWK